MSLRGISRECDYARPSVLAHLNVLALSEKYQNLIWDGAISVSHVQQLEPYFNGGMRIPEITAKLDLVLERKLTRDELRDVIRPELEELESKRVKSAQKAVGKITTRLKTLKR